MGLKSTFVKPFAAFIAKTVKSKRKKAVIDQEKIMKSLVFKARNTAYGKDHNFSKIKSYEDFKNNVPIGDYEDLRPYIDEVVKGKPDILWPGLPKYLAKTSGTTSGVKYIPITKESMPNHIHSTMMALMYYIHQTQDASIFDGKMIFLSGSPKLESKGGIPTGRLSGIVNHEVPAWIRGNQLPSYETNCIEEWEEKLEKVIDETIHEDMRLISGIPPWVQMYYERILARTGKKKIIDVFPNLSLFIYGGVNFEPYRAKLEDLVGKKIDSIELYPASEGFIAFQDDQKDKSLLLNTGTGIFYEFIPNNEVFNANPTRIMLSDVALG
ncbi:MAG TPA: GH3 auxin-responsive promoter family protein, partial [Saprospiraceae bacterium]|nr:GH3 auxin-responsive promoter family protein [Saprospiraceae bacterium]